MAYRSYDEPPAEERRAAGSPAIISRRRLSRAQRPALRVLAFLLLAVSVAGAVLWGGGGAPAWMSVRWGSWGQVNVPGVIAAFLGQVLVSTLQYIFSDWSASWPARFVYTGALAGSIAMSVFGYWPLAHPAIAGLLQWAQLPMPSAQLLAGGILLALLGLLDVVPEKILAA